MPYTPQTWSDNNASYPLSAARMGVIETGVQTATQFGEQGHRILTTGQRDALTGVATGTMIYNSTSSQLQFWNGAAWSAVPFLSPQSAMGTRNVEISISGTSTTTVLTASITPQSSSSKVLVTVSGYGYMTTSGDVSFGDRITRNGTTVFGRTEFHYSSSTYAHFESWGVTYLDTPASTGALAYNYDIVGANRGSMGFARGGGTTGATIVLLEVIG